MITFRRTPQEKQYEEVECQPGTYWRFGKYFFTFIINEKTLITLFRCENRPSVQVYSSMTNNEWEPCTQDEFVEAYVFAMNRISELSGIQHMPLGITYDNTSNPES